MEHNNAELPQYITDLNQNAEQAIKHLLPEHQIEGDMFYADAIELDTSTLKWRDFFSKTEGGLHELWMHVREQDEATAREDIKHFLLNKDSPDDMARYHFTPDQLDNPDGMYGQWIEVFPDIRLYAGTTTLLGGYNGSGKSTLATQIAHMLAREGIKGFILSPEMPPKVTYQIMHRQSTNVDRPTTSEWNTIIQYMKDTFMVSTVEDRITPSGIISQFDAAYAKGYRLMILDSITCVRAGHELYQQADFADLLRNWSRNHADCYLIAVAHMRKPAGYTGGQISRYDIRGAGEISDLAGHVWLLQRKNPYSQREVAQYGDYDAKIIVDKNRATGTLRAKMLRFSNQSKLFHPTTQAPCYIEHLRDQTNVRKIY